MKNFQYYADKAEERLKGLRGVSPEGQQAAAAVAMVYAKLAAAAPKQVRPPVYRGGDRHAAGAPMRDND